MVTVEEFVMQSDNSASWFVCVCLRACVSVYVCIWRKKIGGKKTEQKQHEQNPERLYYWFVNC